MPLGPIEIARIDAAIAALGAVDSAVLGQALGHLLPDIAMRQCDASDVLEEPFRIAAGADLHLLDTSAHCIRVTDDPAVATALLVAHKPLPAQVAA